MNTPWRIELFGGLCVQQGDRVITRFRTQKTGALLAYLAYYPHRAHSREVLATCLWPEFAPSVGRQNLNVALSSLRHQLEPPGAPRGAVIIVDRFSMQLNPAAVTTDVAEFKSALQFEKQAKSVVERAQRLITAVELYRGELLMGYYDESAECPWIEPERRRLNEVYLGALGRLVEDLAAMGDFDGALYYAHRAVNADPLCEAFHRMLMRLYVESGRPAAASRQYHELERLLKTSLNAVPSAAARALAHEISERDKVEKAWPVPSEAEGFTEWWESGKVRKWVGALREAPVQKVCKSLSLSHGSTSSPQVLPTCPLSRFSPSFPSSPPCHPARPGSLPLQFTRFFGREEEIAQLRELLLSEETRLVTLTGVGGGGKTRLAIEVGRRLQDQFAGGVWFAPLADLSDPRLIAEVVRDTLRLPRSPGVDPLEQAAEALSARPVLLILDNLEHLLPEGASAARTLLACAPTLTCLATSRQRLDIEGERAIAVLPLPTPSYKGEPLDGSEPEQPPAPEHLMKFASVQLFVARAQAVRPDFQVTKRNAPAVAALCERLEGIPLAIELAAAWAQTLTPGQMLSQLARRFDWLASRRKDLPERHRTLRATMEWSYRLLAPELQQFLARLSVFRGGFSLEAARAIAGWGVRMTEEPAPSKNSSASLGTGQALEPCTRFPLDFLHQLCERSLATAEEAGSEMRYRLLETLREYAAEKLPPEERVALQRRRAEYYLALAEKARPHLWGGLWQGLWLNRLEAEHDNLRLGLQWWVDNGEAEQGLRMGTALMRFWDLRGHLNEAWERLKELLSMPGASARTTARASALTAAGFLAWELGDYTTARAFHEESLAIWREIGDERCVAGSLNHLGLVAQEQGDYTTACTLYERALTINRRLGNRGSAAVDLNNQGSVALALGDYAEAWALYEQALTINRQLDNCAGIAYNLNGLATVARRQKDDATARALYEECLALCREIGNKWGVAQAFYGLGMAACRQGDTAAARSLFNESLAIYRKLGKKPDIAAALEGMAEAAQTERNSERAARLWGAAASLRETIGAPPPPCDRPDYERNVAAARAALGEKAFAAAWAQGRVLTWQQAIAYALGETT